MIQQLPPSAPPQPSLLPAELARPESRRPRLRRDPQSRRPDPQPHSLAPVLRFSPYAWAKLQFFCHLGPTEIGGFGISSANDLLAVEDFLTVPQVTTEITVAFDDTAVADHFEDQVDAGRMPEQVGRIWLHTHPGESPLPSATDEATFARAFGACDWSVMAILARGGQSYARLQFRAGPGGALVIPVEIDYRRPFAASDPAAWEAEYRAHVHPQPCWGMGDLTNLADPRVALDDLREHLQAEGFFDADPTGL